MALPTDIDFAEPSSPGRAFGAFTSRDPRAMRILAKTIYRELRSGGLSEEDVMSIAGELLHLVTVDMKDRRVASDAPKSEPPFTR